MGRCAGKDGVILRPCKTHTGGTGVLEKGEDGHGDQKGYKREHAQGRNII